MERHANYALVGGLTTLLIFAGLVFVVWLGNVQIGHHTDLYRIVFQGPVRGLSKGGEVQFNGIKVGQIKSIRLNPADATKVLTDVEIDRDTPVRTDSLASSEMQGISGINVVQISAGSMKLPLLKRVSPDQPPVIKSKGDALASLLEGGGKVVQDAIGVLDRVNQLLSDKNLANLTGAIANLKSVSDELAANRAMFQRASSAIDKADRAMTDVQGAAASVRMIADGDGKRAVANAADAAAELKATLVDARGVLHGLSAQSGTLGSTTLPTITATMNSLQRTSDQLDSLIVQIRQDPRGTLLKSSAKDRKLKP